MSQISVGMIGYNDGNGHPFSFSAIINGYNPSKMRDSPYPVIYNYLQKRDMSEMSVGNLKVTHVWCPDKKMAQTIADCSLIANVVDDYKEMLNHVDAVIIARDDVDSHFEIAKFFLENNVFTFVDKPLSIDKKEIEFYTPYLQNGLLMSCSALRYYPAITNYCEGKLKEDTLIYSYSVSLLNWFKYGIHVLEAVTHIHGTDVEWVQNFGSTGDELVKVMYKSGEYALLQTNAKIGFAIRSTFFGAKSNYVVNFDDNFTFFKNGLVEFHKQIISKKPSINPAETLTILKILMAAQESSQENKKIFF